MLDMHKLLRNPLDTTVFGFPEMKMRDNLHNECVNIFHSHCGLEENPHSASGAASGEGGFGGDDGGDGA